MRVIFFLLYAAAGVLCVILGVYQGIALGGGFPYLPPFLGIEGLVGGLMASLLPVVGTLMLTDAWENMNVAQKDETVEV